MDTTVYKIVLERDMKFYSAFTSQHTLEYTLQEMTVGKIGPIFAFDTIEAAGHYAAHTGFPGNDYVRVLEGKGENVRKLDETFFYVGDLTDESSWPEFWRVMDNYKHLVEMSKTMETRKGVESVHTYLPRHYPFYCAAPVYTVICDTFTPEKSWACFTKRTS